MLKKRLIYQKEKNYKNETIIKRIQTILYLYKTKKKQKKSRLFSQSRLHSILIKYDFMN